MDKLVQVTDGQVVVSSRRVAEHFDKQHKHVLDAIENIKAENSAVTPMFCETTYTAGTGKAYKEYLMNRDGFSLLVMGFTGKKALEWKIKYIQAFNAIAEQIDIPEYRYILQAKSAEALNGGVPVLPLQEVERKTYSATEIGAMFGVSANKIGKLANKHNLKTDAYGKLFYSKSEHSVKEVETWRYYDSVIPVFEKIFGREAA